MKVSNLRTEEVQFIPNQLEEGVIYVSRKFGTAIHLCACGCGVQTVTPFECPNGWELTAGRNGVTLRPSIGNQQFPCKSHYWVTDGAVIKC